MKKLPSSISEVRACVVIFAFLLGVLQTNAVAETGRVVDQKSGKAIPKAFVYALWYGRLPNPVSSTRECYSFALTTTDEGGKYELPDYAPDGGWLLVDKFRGVSAYAPGFNPPVILRPSNGVLTLTKSEADSTTRLDSLMKILPSDCVADSKERSVLPLYKAIHSESVELARGDRALERNYVRPMEARIERIQRGQFLQ